MTPLETLACILSAVCHDVGHPALTNRFLIQNRDDLAIQYNDASVLENMHASTTFSILNKPGCNILENLNQEDWFKIRRIILTLILDTDLSRHFEILGRFRAKTMDLSQFDTHSYENKQLIFSMGLKCADLGHSAKNIDLHQKWSALICEEYFRQGDLEKLRKQEISMYCDRDTTNVPKSQASFIKNICLPIFDTWNGFLNCDVIRVTCVDQLELNLNYWINKAKSEKNGEVLSP
jgi:3',5'-cyclic-nucleotide phosphodiesterase/cAMP-specific phosphodiesterase 4